MDIREGVGPGIRMLGRKPFIGQADVWRRSDDILSLLEHGTFQEKGDSMVPVVFTT